MQLKRYLDRHNKEKVSFVGSHRMRTGISADKPVVNHLAHLQNVPAVFASLNLEGLQLQSRMLRVNLLLDDHGTANKFLHLDFVQIRVLVYLFLNFLAVELHQEFSVFVLLKYVHDVINLKIFRRFYRLRPLW